MQIQEKEVKANRFNIDIKRVELETIASEIRNSLTERCKDTFPMTRDKFIHDNLLALNLLNLIYIKLGYPSSFDSTISDIDKTLKDLTER